MDQLLRRHAEVFSKDLVTLPDIVHQQVGEKDERTTLARVPTTLREIFEAELDRLKSKSPSKSGRIDSMGEQCSHSNQEIGCPEDMHRSTPIEPSPEARDITATQLGRFDARVSLSESILNRRSVNRLLVLCS